MSFSRSRFQSYVDFTGTQIGSIAYLGLAQFNGDAYFGDVQFSGDANFQYTRFNGTTNFAEVRFGRKADFNNGHFSGNTFFTQSQFIGNAYFFGSQFISKDVDWVFPRGIANFDLTQFNNYTDFSGAQFSGDADFKGANFAKDLKLNYAGFYNLNLLNVSFKPSALVSLSDGEFMRSDSSRILVRWDSIKNHLVYNELAYLYLIRNFKSLGFFDDADDCYYEYRWNKMFSQTSFFGSLGDIISWASCGYGIGWINTVASAIFMIFLFGIIFSKHFCWDLRNAMWASAIVMLSLPAEWFPFGKDQYENFIKYHRKLAAFERLMGWSLLIILISTLSRIMIRY